MTIILSINSFLEELFPALKGNMKDENIIIRTLQDFYTFKNIKPEVRIIAGLISIDINTEEIKNLQADFNKAIKLCESNRFAEAIPVLRNLIQRNPTDSEYHRILGQAYSMMGNDEEGINSLIDALRWNPKNNYALIMLGNIFARGKDDIETAQKYYQQVIENNPDDAIAINNLGTNLLRFGKLEEGYNYLLKANSINPDYPNSLFGIGLVNQMKGNNQESFEYALKCLKKCGQNEKELASKAIMMLGESAREVVKSNIGEEVFKNYHTELQSKSGREIRIEEDKNLATAAKIEFAENYSRKFHLIKYNGKYPSAYHLMMHELLHLEFVLDAQSTSSNKLFVSGQTELSLFKRNLRSHINSMQKLGLKEDSINSYISALFDGINNQIFNTPIDLFIEDKLYEKYPQMKPYQYASLHTLTMEGIKATTDKTLVKYTPPEILKASKVLNIVSALHFRDLFMIDLVPGFKPTPTESSIANKLYEEFYEYRDDKEPGEEYDLVENWAKDLKLDSYFNLVEEKEYRQDKTFGPIIEKIERDPYDLESHDPEKERSMDDFLKGQKEIGTNMAVVMFMVDALQFFENMPLEKIKDIAYEIALVGTQGYNPNSKNYTISKIPGKIFSGYHILAYYYVSWKIAIPEMLNMLQLPYDKEYVLATTLYKPTKP